MFGLVRQWVASAILPGLGKGGVAGLHPRPRQAATPPAYSSSSAACRWRSFALSLRGHGGTPRARRDASGTAGRLGHGLSGTWLATRWARSRGALRSDACVGAVDTTKRTHLGAASRRGRPGGRVTGGATSVACGPPEAEPVQLRYPSRFDLVGTLKSDDGCSVSGYDQDNQGYGSALVTETVAGSAGSRQCQPKCPTMDDFSSAFSAATPDVVLLHFATNDAWNGKAPADILSAYRTIVQAARVANPRVTILVAQIIPMNVTASTCSGCSCASCASTISALNSQITTWAPGVSTAESPVIVVDQCTGFDATTDTRDGVHPNASGSQKMAKKWFEALKALF